MTHEPGPPLLPSLAPSLMPEVRTYLSRHHAELEKLFDEPGRAGLTLSTRRSKVLDGMLLCLFQAARAVLNRGIGGPVLAAVGGYGRQLVGWKSDVDVRLLTTGPANELQSLAETFLHPLWDAGLSVGHQVVGEDEVLELARHDLPTTTSLLDWRHLDGDASTSERFVSRARRELFSATELPKLLQRFEEEAVARHERCGGSVYLLEPDVKQGEGGLRDLDVALWAARARWGTSRWEDLARLGALTTAEAEALARAAELLWTVRNHLHRRAGRRSDRLTFAMQEQLARALGYAPVSVDDDALGPYVEAFMSDYYRQARTISRLREQLLARAQPRRRGKAQKGVDLGDGLRSIEGQVGLTDETQLTGRPALALRLYAKAIERREPVHPLSRDAVARATQSESFRDALRSCRESIALFLELLVSLDSGPFRSVLGALHEVGLLAAMIPEFSPVIGRVHHDVYHVYTVDIHSIAAVDRLRALLRGELEEAHPLASRVAKEMTQPKVALLATLLHDIGKVIGGKDHARRGAVMSRTILERLGLAEVEIEAVCYLVDRHLAMYHVAMRRDFEDPATVAEFAREARDPTMLRALYLLTVADLSTTSPTAMTSWKARMLDDLFLATEAHFSGAHAARRSARVREEARARFGASPFLDAFLDSMPERYLLAHEAEIIVAHARAAEAGLGERVAVSLLPSKSAEMAELCVVGADRPGFLAAVTAAVSANGLEVHKAEIHSRPLPDGNVQAFDLLWVRHTSMGAEGVANVLAKLRDDLRAILADELVAEELLSRRGWSSWRERPTPAVETKVTIDARTSPKYAVIEVLTRDRPGLLFTLAQTLHELGLSIALAKIATEGTRATDVFYVTEDDGSKPTDDLRRARIRDRILDALVQPGTEGNLR